MKRISFLILAAALMMMTACDKEDVAVTGLYFNPSISLLTLEVGDAEILKAFVMPDNATDKKVIWSSDKPTIAMVNNKGEVTAKAMGTATITVATREGGYTTNWIVEVITTGQKKMTLTQESGYDNMLLYVNGRSTFTIDWDDGSAIETHTLKSEPNYVNGYSHSYSDRSSKTITLTGGNISNLSVQANIISLDLRDNIALTVLGCNLNALKELDLSNNTILKYLSCNYNQLKSLDISKNTSLISLDCCVNSLTILSLNNNKALTFLDCSNNQLSMLDVSKNTALTELNCWQNQLDTDALNALFKTLHSNAGTKRIYIGGNPGTNRCDRSIATSKGWTVADWH